MIGVYDFNTIPETSQSVPRHTNAQHFIKYFVRVLLLLVLLPEKLAHGYHRSVSDIIIGHGKRSFFFSVCSESLTLHTYLFSITRCNRLNKHTLLPDTSFTGTALSRSFTCSARVICVIICTHLWEEKVRNSIAPKHIHCTRWKK